MISPTVDDFTCKFKSLLQLYNIRNGVDTQADITVSGCLEHTNKPTATESMPMTAAYPLVLKDKPPKRILVYSNYKKENMIVPFKHYRTKLPFLACCLFSDWLGQP